MNIFTFLHFFAFLVYLYLAIFILIKDPKSALNRVFAVPPACFAVWSFGLIFIYNPNIPKDTAILFGNITSIGWTNFPIFFLWFALIFTEKKKILKTKIIYPLIFILPFLFIYKQWTGFLRVDYIKQLWGWRGVWSGSIWTYLFYLYYLSFIATGLYLILNFGRKTEEPLKKKQAKIIFVAMLVSLILGTLTDVILPELNIRMIPPSLGNLITLIWASGMTYAITKYKLMVITPVAAADNIISTMTDSLILLDRQGNVASVNKATLDLSGYGKDELEGKSVEIFLVEKNFKNILLDKAIKKETIRNYELNFKTKTGDNIPVIFSSSTMMDEAGGMAGIVCIIKDITERKQAEDALKKAHDQLENKVAQRTEELQKANLKLRELDQLKSMFIASMNHELRTPLSLIIGFTDIILQEISGEINQEQRRQFTLVKKNANHLLSLINDILDVNKIETGKVEMIIEEFDLSALSQEIKDNFRIAADKKELELSFKIPPTLLIESDRRRTKQILVNLLSNALKFTDRGEIKIKIATKDKMVEMSVQDSGSGIKKEDMDKLFNAFSQIPNPGKIEEGTGLGLYLSKKNAYLLGGDIRAESELGKGSVFTLTLPLKYKEAKV